MIVSRFLIITSLLHLVVKITCNRDDFAQSSLDRGANLSVNSAIDATTETQHTTCKITTERLVANAQATFTRVLTGACNAKTIDERFVNLENSINKRLDEIKELITHAMLKKWNITEPVNLSFSERAAFSDDNNFADAIAEMNPEDIENIPPARRNQVKRFNNSIHDGSTSDERKVYTYYWRVANIHEKLQQWGTGRSERSSTFYVGNTGYAMYLKFTPKYFPDGTVFVSVGLTKGVDDSRLVWPFPLSIRIKILDLSMYNEPEDRSSRLWDPATICSSYFWGRPGMFGESDNPECVGLSVPRQLLVGEQVHGSSNIHDSATFNGIYVRNNCILVELTVYL